MFEQKQGQGMTLVQKKIQNYDKFYYKKLYHRDLDGSLYLKGTQQARNQGISFK